MDIGHDVELQKTRSEGLVDTRLEPLDAQTQADEPRDSTTDNKNRFGHIVWAPDAKHGQSLRIPSPLAQEKGTIGTTRFEHRQLIIQT